MKTVIVLFALLYGVLLSIVPLSYPASALKQKKHIFSFNLNNLSVPLFGFNVKGTINFVSFSPLVFNMDAEKASFDIAQFKKFLLQNNCIDQSLADKIPEIKQINGTHVKVYFDSAKKILLFLSDLLKIEDSQIKSLGLFLSEGGFFKLIFKNASIETSLLKKLIYKDPEKASLLKNLLSLLSIKELKTGGKLIIFSLNLSGTLKNVKKISGSFKLKGDHIKFIAKSGDTCQTFSVDQLDSEVTLQDGIPTITINHIHICSLPKGSAEINGIIKGIPPDFYETELACSLDSFRIFNSEIDLNLLKKKESRPVSFDFSLNNPSITLSSKGKIVPRKKDIYIKIYKSCLNVSGLSEGIEFNFNTLSKIDFSSEISVDSLNINNLLRLEHVLLRTKPTNKGLVFTGNARASELNISLAGIFDPSAKLTSQIEFKAADIDLTSFIASFSKELPVFLKGRLYINGNFLIQGNDLQSILKNSTGDIVVTIDRLFVCKVSHIDPRLGFFLDILRIAGIKPQQEDSLLFKKCVIRGILKEENLILKRFILTGSPISVLANGTFFINKKRLSMTGLVKTGIGIKKHLKIDRYLKKEI